MATTLLNTPHVSRRSDGELVHRICVMLAAFAVVSLIGTIAFVGFDYYRLDLQARVESPLHPLLRSSGTIGIQLGILGVCLFLILFLYPLRKRWRWLASIGKTRHWLNYHSLVGMTAPVVITFHSAFKFGGLAGVAYWIMIAVALSGFVGRYLYTKIPRSMTATELTMDELQAQARELASALERQAILSGEAFAPLLQMPAPASVRKMSLVSLLWTILRLDLTRPFLVSGLRRRVLSGFEKAITLGGFRKSSNPELETVIAAVRQQSRLAARMAFLGRIHQAFHLWHVIHRPFSFSFSVLVIVHIVVVFMLGYY
jgi:hypothetical protein